MSKEIIIGGLNSLTKLNPGYDDYVGALKVYSDGTSKQIVGAYNAFNTRQAFYDGNNEVLDLYSSSSDLMSRINGEGLFSEHGHPVWDLANETEDEFILRNAIYDKLRYSTQILNLELIECKDLFEWKKYGNVKLVVATFKPHGPFGDLIKSRIDSPNANNFYSLRCYMDRFKSKEGIWIHTVDEVLTYDTVDRPGVRYSSKGLTKELGLEGEMVQGITQINLANYNKQSISTLSTALNNNLYNTSLDTYARNQISKLLSKLECDVCNVINLKNDVRRLDVETVLNRWCK